MARDYTDEPEEHDELDDVDELGQDTDDVVDDFDAFWQQHTAAEKREHVRIMDQRVPVPADIPIVRLQEIERIDVDADENEVRDVVAELFGGNVLDAWIDAGMTSRQFGTILAWAVRRAQGHKTTFAEAARLVEQGDQGKAQPNRQQRRAAASSRRKSAPAGERSSRTSAGSTGSRRRSSQR